MVTGRGEVGTGGAEEGGPPLSGFEAVEPAAVPQNISSWFNGPMGRTNQL